MPCSTAHGELIKQRKPRLGLCHEKRGVLPPWPEARAQGGTALTPCFAGGNAAGALGEHLSWGCIVGPAQHWARVGNHSAALSWAPRNEPLILPQVGGKAASPRRAAPRERCPRASSNFLQ